jgi:hypothetical protein
VLIRTWVQGDGERRLVVDHPAARGLAEPLQGRPHAQGLGQQGVVVAAVGEVEAEEHVEGLAVERAHRQEGRRQVEHQPVLFQDRLQRRRIHLPRAETLRLHGGPAVAALVLVLLENIVPLVSAVELPHRRELLLHPLEVVEDRLPLRREFHLRRQVHVDVEVVGQRRILRHSMNSQGSRGQNRTKV